MAIKSGGNDSERANIRKLLSSGYEFETFDTGQTADIEQKLLDFIDLLSKSGKSTFSEVAIEIFNSGLIQRDAHWYNSISTSRRSFIESFKKSVLQFIDNKMSLVVRIDDCLFTGDSEPDQIKSVCSYISNNGPKINIIKVPHHGSYYNHCDDLYLSLRPILAINSRRTNVDETRVTDFLHSNYITTIGTRDRKEKANRRIGFLIEPCSICSPYSVYQVLK